jgi:hypothetical protein
MAFYIRLHIHINQDLTALIAARRVFLVGNFKLNKKL